MTSSAILECISAHHPIAYFGIFLIAFSESLAMIGLLIPGTLLMFGVGAIISTGALSLRPTLLLAILGAIAGDGISYWIGHRYHHRLRAFRPFRRNPGLLLRGENFFQRHGGLGIFLGRFVGPIRPVIPMVAGMLDMSPPKFIVINILSAVGWAFAYLLPGVFFGTSLALAGTVSTRLAVLIVLLTCTLWVSLWFCRKCFLWLSRYGPSCFSYLEKWVALETPSTGMLRIPKGFLQFLFHRRKGEEYLLLFLVLLFFFTTWGFFTVLQDLMAGDPLVQVNQSLYHLLESLRTPWGDHFFVAVAELGGGLVNFSIAGVIFLILIAARCGRTAGYWAGVLLGAVILSRISLHTLVRVPPTIQIAKTGFLERFGDSSLLVLVLYGFLAVILSRGSGNTRRSLSLVTVVFFIAFLTSFTPLYLGNHVLSDILSGLALGGAWTTLTGIAYIKGPPEKIPKRLLLSSVLLTFFITGPLYIAGKHREDLLLYAPQHRVQLIREKEWIQGEWENLPARRIDFEGELKQPLIFQWAGRSEDLTVFLRRRGWRLPPPFTLRVFLGMLSPETRVEGLPLFPKLHEGRFERILLFQHAGRTRRVFRLWSTESQLKESGTPLWVGTMEIQSVRRIGDFLSVPRDLKDYRKSQRILSGIFLEGCPYTFLQVVHRKSFQKTGEKIQEGFKWDGRTLLGMNLPP